PAVASLAVFPAPSVTVATTSYREPELNCPSTPLIGVAVPRSSDQMPSCGVTLYVAPLTLTVNVSPGCRTTVPPINGVTLAVSTLSTVGTDGIVVLSTTACIATEPDSRVVVFVTRACSAQFPVCAWVSVTFQLVPTVVAVLHVAPPSKETS